MPTPLTCVLDMSLEKDVEMMGRRILGRSFRAHMFARGVAPASRDDEAD